MFVCFWSEVERTDESFQTLLERIRRFLLFSEILMVGTVLRRSNLGNSCRDEKSGCSIGA